MAFVLAEKRTAHDDHPFLSDICIHVHVHGLPLQVIMNGNQVPISTEITQEAMDAGPEVRTGWGVGLALRLLIISNSIRAMLLWCLASVQTDALEGCKGIDICRGTGRFCKPTALMRLLPAADLWQSHALCACH